MKLWADLDADVRQSLLDAYHARGIAVMFSLFGSTDEATSRDKRDPVQFADEVADFALQYGLDGVDVDYEDFPAANSGTLVAWLVRELHDSGPELTRSFPETPEGAAAASPDLAWCVYRSR